MKLTLIRHGQTNYNLKDLCNGRPSSRVFLTKLGREQAKAAAKKLAREKFDAIYISELRRSKQTAEYINVYHKVKLIKDKRLNDRSMGEFEDRPASLFYSWRDAHANRWTCRPKGGESYEQMKKRAYSFLKDLSKKDYKNVLVVSHLPILKVMRGYFKGLNNQQMDALTDKQVHNTKIFRFTLPPFKKS